MKLRLWALLLILLASAPTSSYAEPKNTAKQEPKAPAAPQTGNATQKVVVQTEQLIDEMAALNLGKSCIHYDPKRKHPGRFSTPAHYVEWMTPIALLVQRHTGWPASLILAKSGLEAGWGNANPGGYNYFGIGCSPNASYVIPRSTFAGGDLKSKTIGCSEVMGAGRWSWFASAESATIGYASHFLMHPGDPRYVNLDTAFCSAREGVKEHLFARFPKLLSTASRGWSKQQMSDFLRQAKIAHNPNTTMSVCAMRLQYAKQLPYQAIGTDIQSLLSILAAAGVSSIPPIDIWKMNPRQFQELLANWEGHNEDKGLYSRQIRSILENPIYKLKGIDQLRLCEAPPPKPQTTAGKPFLSGVPVRTEPGQAKPAAAAPPKTPPTTPQSKAKSKVARPQAARPAS